MRSLRRAGGMPAHAARDAAAVDLAALAAAVQRNCDIADARHGGELSMCIYLLQMRELYRWECGAPLGATLHRRDVGDWIARREGHWDALAREPYRALPVGDGSVDPFDVDAVGAALAPHGLVYGAGQLAGGRAIFVLGEQLHSHAHGELQVQVVGREHARGLAAPPAALHGRRVLLRRDALVRWLWQQYEAHELHPGGAFAAALAACGYREGGDAAAALERLADEQLDVLLLHESGEHRAGRLLGPRWDALRAATGGDRLIEAYLRTLRDHLADCLVTLPAVLDRPSPAALHLWFATLDGLRLEVFPALPQAYAEWCRGDGGTRLRALASAGSRHWLALGAELADRFADLGAAAVAQRLGEASVRCCG